jgi:hypothetical protein
MRLFVPFAALMLASCGLPGTGPAQWTTMPPVKFAELEEPVPGTRPAPPDVTPAAKPVAAAAAAPSASEADEAPAKAAAVPAAAEPAVQAARSQNSDVEALRDVALSRPQVRAVQAGVRDALRNDSARVDRMVAGQNSLGVVFVCGYAEGGGAEGRQAFRGVLMGKDRSQPKFVPVSSSGASAEQQATAQLCAEQGIPLAAAVEVASAPPAEGPAPEDTASEAVEPAAVPVTEAAPAIAAAPAVPPAPAAPAAPAALPRVVLTEPQINIIQAGVKNSLKAPSVVFGRMLAAADAKGGIVVCGYVNPTGGDGGTGIQPFTGVLIGNGDNRNFVPVSFGRDDVEKRQTMQVCAGQGIPL